MARLTLVAGSVIVLVTGVSTSAQAATGTFFYNRADTGFRESLGDPPDDTCLPMSGGAAIADNFTDTTAVLYRDENCTIGQDSLSPNESGVYGGATVPHSVMFG
ncbi:hypothetical protein ACF06X_34475 [Streptomyces sp. NPDC015346]|uniref:hypothetical protein n=1 Tax=Streptomyces sp. NPDC015346 TaxID=3364954 RepID=UPI0037006658